MIKNPNLKGGCGRSVPLVKLAEIVWRLSLRSFNAEELAQAFDLWHDSARVILRRLQELGLLHVCGWDQRGRGPYMPRYAFKFYAHGIAEDVPKPEVYQRPGRKPRPPRKTRTNVTGDAAKLARFIFVLMEEPTSLPDAADLADMSHDTACKLANAMHGKLFHIPKVGHRHETRSGGAWVQLWRFGINTEDRREKPREFKRERAAHARAGRYAVEKQRRDALRSSIELLHRMAGNASNLGRFKQTEAA